MAVDRLGGSEIPFVGFSASGGTLRPVSISSFVIGLLKESAAALYPILIDMLYSTRI